MQSAKLITGPINHLRQCRHGFMLFNCNDVYIGKSLDFYGEWSEGEMEVFRQIVKPGEIAIDAGANIGTHALVLAKAVGPQGRVYAFEPQRIVFQTLCANMALNSMTNAFCYQAALGAERGTINVPALDFSKVNNFGGLSLDLDVRGETVDLITLDNLNLPACCLLKADVEGMELMVLQGAAELIDRHKPWLYLENDRPDKAPALMKHIDALDYEMYWHMPPLFNPNNYFRNPTNVFSNIVSGNLLCVHKSLKANIGTGLKRTYPGERHPFGG